jgi:hypothetical protein
MHLGPYPIVAGTRTRRLARAASGSLAALLVFGALIFSGTPISGSLALADDAPAPDVFVKESLSPFTVKYCLATDDQRGQSPARLRTFVRR